MKALLKEMSGFEYFLIKDMFVASVNRKLQTHFIKDNSLQKLDLKFMLKVC